MKKRLLNPFIIIFLSFVGVILAGTILLLLPISVKGDEDSLSFVNALFMAASATCVTGLSVITDVGVSFSVFGKIVLVILMEIGGLSFITIAIFFMILAGNKIGISERYLVKETLNVDKVQGTVSLVKKIVLISFCIQIGGMIINTLILAIGYSDLYTFWEALGIGAFHAVSSYNNAGFDIFNNGALQAGSSMQYFSGDVLLNISTMLLIILGGISVVVMLDVAQKRNWKKLSLHTKIVLSMTLILVVSGTLLIKASLGKDISFLEALFQSVTSRTAGFATIDLSSVPNACLIIIIILMFIGASPCSTGGGIKSTTVFVIISSVFATMRGRKAHAFNRELPDNAIHKAYTLFALAVSTCILSLLLVSFFDKDLTTRQLFFEVVSAFATVGLSTGITTTLSIGSKIVLVFTMIVGRVGLLTLINIVNKRGGAETHSSYQLIEGKVLIG